MTALRWGVTEYEETEALRPEFDGVDGKSIIDGSPTKIFSNYERKKRFRVAALIISFKITIVTCCFAAVFYFKYYTSHVTTDPFLQVYGPTIADITNAVNHDMIQKALFFFVCLLASHAHLSHRSKFKL